MSSSCGNSVQTLWVSMLKTCRYPSTTSYSISPAINSTYGNLPVLLNFIHFFPINYTQLKTSVLYLLNCSLSTLSTPTIITKKKELKEI